MRIDARGNGEPLISFHGTPPGGADSALLKLETSGFLHLDSGSLAIGQPSIGGNGSLLVFNSNSAPNTVLGQFEMNIAASNSDAGAFRSVIRQMGGEATNARAGEFQAIRSSAVTGNNSTTWGQEIGLHLASAPWPGSIQAAGIFLFNDHANWVDGPGYRANTGLVIAGRDGWETAIRYLDTDNRELFSVDQTGTVRATSAVFKNGANFSLVCPRGQAVTQLTVSGGVVTGASCATP